MKKTEQNGFTIAELVVAIVLLGIALPSVAMLADTLTRMNDSATDTVLATSIAENKVESLRSKGFNALSDGTTPFTSDLPDRLPSPKSGSYTISTVNSALKQITMTIKYGNKESSYVTYIGELGVAQY